MPFTIFPVKTQTLFRWFVGLLIAACLAFVACRHWWESRHWVETDNAYLDGPVHPIAARLIGTVEEVLVEENSRVRQGQILLRLDPREAQIRREQSEAKLAESKASLMSAEAAMILAQAKTRLDEITLEKNRLDLDRMLGLTTGSRAAVARQELDHAQAAFDAANASLTSSRRSVDVAKAEIVVSRAKESSAAAVLKEAALQCEYTTITAPVDGRVGRRNVETGQPVIPAQPLIALVGDGLWLTANFKETQIAAIKPGQSALIRFDACPDREWPGTVESLSPASGSRFALLPPDNATGNFTRVVQRLPVRIRIDESALAELGTRIAPGLSAEVRVRVSPNPKSVSQPPVNLTQR